MKTRLFILVVLAFVLVLTINQISAVTDTLYVGDYKIDYTYNNADSGDKFTLTVTITNEDNEIKNNIDFELNSDSVFDIDDEDWSIDSLESDESLTKTFRVEIDEDTSKGNYDLEFSLEDSEDDYEDEFEIEVSSDKADFLIGDIVSTPGTIMPDQNDVKIEITLENTGGGDADFVKAKLILPDGFSSSSSFSDITNLGTIEAGENKIATFYIDTEKTLKSGNSQATLVLDYQTDSDDRRDDLVVNIPVKGKPIFNVVGSSNIPSNLEIGTNENELRIVIQNVGEEIGKETSVRVFENADMPFEFNEKTNFIGNLDEGETGTAVFHFDLDSSFSAKDYFLKFQVRTVNKNNVLISEFSIPIKTIPAQSKGFSPVWILVILIVVVLIIIFFVYRGRGKKTKQKIHKKSVRKEG